MSGAAVRRMFAHALLPSGTTTAAFPRRPSAGRSRTVRLPFRCKASIFRSKPRIWCSTMQPMALCDRSDRHTLLLVCPSGSRSRPAPPPSGLIRHGCACCRPRGFDRTVRLLGLWRGCLHGRALPSCRCGHPKPWPVADLAVSYRRRAAAFDTCLNCIKKRAHQLHVGWPGDPSLRPMTGPITVTQPTCFVVLYDRPARDYDFTLRLDGFQVGDTLVLPQEISFKRGEYLRGGQPW